MEILSLKLQQQPCFDDRSEALDDRVNVVTANGKRNDRVRRRESPVVECGKPRNEPSGGWSCVMSRAGQCSFDRRRSDHTSRGGHSAEAVTCEASPRSKG